MNGTLFDPHAHFSEWRERQLAWTTSKWERADVARSRALALKAEGKTNSEIAHHLNDEGIRSLSGKPWSADGVRKFLAQKR